MFKFILLTSSLFSNISLAFTDFYPKNYNESRKEFLSLSKTFQDAQIGSYKIENPDNYNDDLSIDYIYIPPKSDDLSKSKILLLTSGTHGSEASVGTAAQIYFLKNHAQRVRSQQTGILLIHAINPFGYKYNRRVNEKNIDLNRNFSTSKKLFDTKNEGYTKIEKNLNPKEKITSISGRLLSTTASLLWKLLFKGFTIKELREASVKGQYKYPAGIYYGGQAFQPPVVFLENLLPSILNGYNQLFHLDFHTGLGENGQLHLITSSNTSPAEARKIRGIFNEVEGKNYVLSTPSDSGFYPTTGDMVDYVAEIAKLSNVKTRISLTAEFGTMGLSTINQVKTIHRIILENQGHHFGYVRSNTKKYVDEKFKELFFPTDIKWRNEVQRKIKYIFSKPLEFFLKDGER